MLLKTIKNQKIIELKCIHVLSLIWHLWGWLWQEIKWVWFRALACGISTVETNHCQAFLITDTLQLFFLSIHISSLTDQNLTIQNSERISSELKLDSSEWVFWTLMDHFLIRFYCLTITVLAFPLHNQ